ncbi:hypothetical protein HDU67_005137, partial [Dinochytrium kinnereticum]
TFAIPEPLLDEFHAWVAVQIDGNFKDLEAGLTLYEPQDPVVAAGANEMVDEGVAIAADEENSTPVSTDAVMGDGALAIAKPVLADGTVQAAGGDPAAKKRKGPPTFSVNCEGVKLVRYLHVLINMMKDFPKLPKDARAAVKKGVKEFLLLHKQGDISQCLIFAEQDEQQTYGIPEDMIDWFKTWAYRELKRCFPEYQILTPEEVKVF